MIERYRTPEQLAEYRRQEELRRPPESKARQWIGPQIFHFSRTSYVDHAWAASRTVEELDAIVEDFVQVKSSMTYGVRRTGRAISSAVGKRIWKSGLTGPGI